MLRFKQYIRELTISPDYQSRGEFNPFYDLDINLKDISDVVGNGKIKFRSVDNGAGTLIKNYGGKYNFQIVLDDEDTDKFITTPKKNVIGHHGQKTRKDSTASSNVNEVMSLFFLVNKDFVDAETFIRDVGGKTGPTGVHKGDESSFTYEELIGLLDRDETAERDVTIGYQNSLKIKDDLPMSYSKLYWTPREKPSGIDKKNPSDVIVKLSNGNFVGYSNKISAGKDKTPKINTNLTAFYSKLKDKRQLTNIQRMIDDSWNKTVMSVKTPNAKKVLNGFDISNEKFSESSSQRKFASLAKEFKKDKLNFYKEDFYIPFRNNLIQSFSNYLKNPSNLLYFLTTVGYYTYPDADATPCPYKLLIGSESSSKIKEVSSDEDNKQIFLSSKTTDLSGLTSKYDGRQQTFNFGFVYKPSKKKVSFPVVLRTRQAGGWGGKSLYVTTSGFKIQ